VVQIVNDDMPFLVDSATSAFQTLDLTVHTVFHPIIQLTRGAKGRRNRICEAGLGDPDVLRESFMHFEITHESKDGHARIRKALAAVLDDVLQDLKVALDEAEVRVTRGELPEVLADPSQLRQLFQNLLANAIKCRGDAPGRVHVSAEREGDRWRFAVRDEGIGLDPSQAERIFKIFKRLHPRGQYEGTGLGLAICKRIVERHGGEIGVESQPGEGATFWFTLPAAEPKRGEPAGAGADDGAPDARSAANGHGAPGAVNGAAQGLIAVLFGDGLLSYPVTQIVNTLITAPFMAGAFIVVSARKT